ncbi:hypothetical protein WR25_04664 [Diploscapter pachys]|uniref:Uncharacterized protein n=1 Tax=Diploscapter pachys TaxID=2018661 RepID=A0A2A2L118_9BILA|nr:hypothetical protein WR25_04664 [Diploscapter pachys]
MPSNRESISIEARDEDERVRLAHSQAVRRRRRARGFEVKSFLYFHSNSATKCSGLDFEDAIFDGQDGHIESTTTKIEDEDVALATAFLVESVCDGCRSRLVDETEHVQSSDSSSILVLHITLHDLVVELPADEALGVENGVVRVYGCLALGRVPDPTFRVSEGHVAGGHEVALKL